VIQPTTPSATISVVIRVRNEGPALRKVLDALASQDLKPIEIVVVDNASADDTRAVAQHQGAKIVEIPNGDFTYGKALNAGIRQTSGEFVCILSAHSLPIGPDFLRNALAPFADPTIAAVRLLSVTNRTALENWAKRTILESPVEIETVISAAPLNAAAMIRRLVWEQIPYDETLASVEDKFWAVDVLKRGYRICNSPATFLYLRDWGLYDRVRIMNRDRVEFFRKTGRQLQDPPVSLRRLVANIFYNIPLRAIHAVIYETALYACLSTVPLQDKRKYKIG
jgi:glycosyltransferase involved in cell wall biosynthesis